MFDILLMGVFVLLLVNVTVAFVVTARTRIADRWQLSLLLAGTSGAALVLVLSMLLGPEASSRFVDVAVVLIALASLTAAVRVSASNRVAARVAPGGDGQ